MEGGETQAEWKGREGRGRGRVKSKSKSKRRDER